MESLDKLFFLKKLKTLDYLLIFLLIIAISVAAFYFSRKKSAIYIYTLDVPVQWTDSPPSTYSWISNSINKGDMAYDPTGAKVAEVVAVDNVDLGGQHRSARLILKVNTLFDKRTRQYRLRDRLLQVGNTISLDIGNTKYEGMISYIGETISPPDSQYRYMKVKLKAYDVEPWLAETYDTSFVVTNSEGKEIFRIIDSLIRPAEKTVPTDRGELVKGYDPLKKEVYITAKVYVRCQEEVCYFNEILPVKVGLWLWTQSNTSIIEGTARILEIGDWVDAGK